MTKEVTQTRSKSLWNHSEPSEFHKQITKVRSFEEDSCPILISFKGVVIFSEIKKKISENDNTFERNEDCATVLSK